MFTIAKKEIFETEEEKSKWEEVKNKFKECGLSVNVLRGKAPSEIAKGEFFNVYTATVYCESASILNVPVAIKLNAILDCLLTIPDMYDIMLSSK